MQGCELTPITYRKAMHTRAAVSAAKSSTSVATSHRRHMSRFLDPERRHIAHLGCIGVD